MGTNYYYCLDVCDSCGHAKQELHIGKSSGGWTFSFRGYRDSCEVDVPILSEADWKRFMGRHKGIIRDEYGKTIPEKKFWAIVSAKRKEELNHTTYCKKYHPDHYERDCWLDKKGNSFSGSEFS